MADRSGLGIIQFKVRGEPKHADHPHVPGTEDVHDAGLPRGKAALGPLGYSLLRSDTHAKMHHRRRALDRIIAERDDLDSGRDRRHAEGAASHGDPWDRDRGFLRWDLIGVLAETCESLAAAVSAQRDELPGGDFGKAMLRFNAPVNGVFSTAHFGDLDWWKVQLNADDRTIEQLQAEMPAAPHDRCRRIVGRASAQLVEALDDIRRTYTNQVHRIAQRRKHGVSYVSPWHGYIWCPDDEPEREAVGRAVENGAFVELDGEDEWIVPADRPTFDRFVATTMRTSWLLTVLSAALVGKAENPIPRTVLYPNLFEPVADFEELRAIGLALTSNDDGLDAKALMEVSKRKDDIVRGNAVWGPRPVLSRWAPATSCPAQRGPGSGGSIAGQVLHNHAIAFEARPTRRYVHTDPVRS